jgi:hypothetical protein
MSGGRTSFSANDNVGGGQVSRSYGPQNSEDRDTSIGATSVFVICVAIAVLIPILLYMKNWAQQVRQYSAFADR